MPLSPLHWLGLLLIRNTRPAARVATPFSPSAGFAFKWLLFTDTDKVVRLERIETFTTKQVEVNLAEDRDEAGDWRVEYFDPKIGARNTSTPSTAPAM